MKDKPEKKPSIILHTGYFEEREVVRIYFDYNRSIIEILRTFRGAWWDPEFRCWCIPQDVFELEWFLLALNSHAEIDHSRLKEALSPNSQDFPNPEKTKKQAAKKIKKKDVMLPPNFLETLERKRYSPRTIAIYSCYIKDYIREFGQEKLKLCQKYLQNMKYLPCLQ